MNEIKREFINIVEAGGQPSPQLLQLVVGLLKRQHPGQPKKADRDSAIRASVAWVVKQGLPKTRAKGIVFPAFSGPTDPRERDRILSKVPCELLLALESVDGDGTPVVELLFSESEDAWLVATTDVKHCHTDGKVDAELSFATQGENLCWLRLSQAELGWWPIRGKQ